MGFSQWVSLVWVHIKYCTGHTYAEPFVVHLKFSFHWASCILPGNPKNTKSGPSVLQLINYRWLVRVSLHCLLLGLWVLPKVSDFDWMWRYFEVWNFLRITQRSQGSVFSTLGQADNSEILPILQVNGPQSKNLGINCIPPGSCDIQFLYQRNVVRVSTDSETEFPNLLTLVPLLNNLVPNQEKSLFPLSGMRFQSW